MDRAEFIARAQKAGWLLFSSCNEGLTLVCAHPACEEALFIPASLVSAGTMPEACEGPHEPQFAGHVIDSYDDLVSALAQTRARYGVSQLDTSATAGLGDGHINKLENGDRTATWGTLFAWLATLGYRIRLEPVPLPHQTVETIDARARRPMPERWRRIPARRLGKSRGRVPLFRLCRVGGGGDDDGEEPAGPWAAE